MIHETGTEHYRCHVIHVKQTKSERVSDTVFFKTKFITQPTLMPADVITKALNDLTQALKGKSNQKGIDQIEALTKLNDILSNTPEPDPAPDEPIVPTAPRQVTFDDTTKPAQIEEPINEIPPPRVTKPTERMRPEPMHKVTIDKAILNASTPRVEKSKSKPKSNDNRERIRKYITQKTMARIPLRKSYLRRSTRTTERSQMIYDEETNTYLKYRQLMQHPKYKKVWSKSAANEFGRLANGLKDGRIKPTNTIRFIKKEEIPAERMKDVTYGSFSCDLKPNKEEVNRTRLTMGGDRINYPDDCGTPTADDMILFKILVNSIISTPNAKCLMWT